MKKFLASALCITMAMSIAACSGKQPEQTTVSSETTAQVIETTETTAETTVETTTAAETTTETTAATTAKILTKKDYVKNVRSKTNSLRYNYIHHYFHFPTNNHQTEPIHLPSYCHRFQQF